MYQLQLQIKQKVIMSQYKAQTNKLVINHNLHGNEPVVVKSLHQAIGNCDLSTAHRIIKKRFTRIDNVLTDAPTLCVLQSGEGFAFYRCDKYGCIAFSDKIAEVKFDLNNYIN